MSALGNEPRISFMFLITVITLFIGASMRD